MDYQRVTNNIRKELKTYITDSGIKSLVIGLSGGIDSALCVALAKPVCDEMDISIIGRSIPIETNKRDEIDRARKTGENFCHNFNEVSFGKIYRAMDERIHIIEQKPNTKIAQGNIKARIRMIYLYNIAGMNNGLVLSTDNYTELLLGFWTIHGDVGDYGMLQNLWKTEVYGLSNHIADALKDDGAKESLRASIQATPTDGLGITNSDLEQIGAKNYDEVDEILQSYLLGYKKYVNHPVVQRYERTHFKRNNPFNLSRDQVI